MVDIKDRLDVPGTTVILDEAAEASGNNNFTLVPKPSDDPDDPLNWSQGRKWLQTACLVTYVISVCFNAGCLYPIYGPLSEATGLSLAQINTGVGFFYLIEAVGALFTLPLTLAIGKRPVFIFSALAACVFPFALSGVRTNSQWIGLCIVNGFILSPLFVAPEAALSDVFFYHERALPFGIYIAATYGGALVAPVMSGFIYDGLGWKGPPYLAGGFSILVSIFLFVFLEETNFKRPHAAAPARGASISQRTSVDHTATLGRHPTSTLEDSDVKEKGLANAVAVTEATQEVHSYDRIVSPWKGPKPFQLFKISPYAGGILLRGILQPLAMLRLPIILWCGMMFGIYQIFYNAMAALSSGVLSETPYNFRPNMVGLTFISPLLAIIPGAICGGWISDRFTILQARKNSGVSEAEHKLKLYIVPTILSPFGLLMIGLGPYYGAHWMVFVAGEFILTVAGPLATLLSITYAFDSFHGIHPDEQEGPRADVQQAAPYLLSLILVGMCFTFGFNYAITPWAFDWGFRNFAISAACIGTALNLTAFAMVKWGKRLRASGASYYSKIINW